MEADVRLRPGGPEGDGDRPLHGASVDDAKGVFIRAEFSSVEQAKAFRERLIASGALDRPGVTVKVGPTVVEQVETITY